MDLDDGDDDDEEDEDDDDDDEDDEEDVDDGVDADGDVEPVSDVAAAAKKMLLKILPLCCICQVHSRLHLLSSTRQAKKATPLRQLTFALEAHYNNMPKALE